MVLAGAVREVLNLDIAMIVSPNLRAAWPLEERLSRRSKQRGACRRKLLRIGTVPLEITLRTPAKIFDVATSIF